MTAPLPASIAVIGGTGAMGYALARRFARAGHTVIVGSRDPGKAEMAATQIKNEGGASRISGAGNAAAAERSEILVLTVPFSGHGASLGEIATAARGKIVIDATAPVGPPNIATVKLPPMGSAAVAAQNFLGPDVRVVSAFQNVAAAKLLGNSPIECDVLVCGDDAAARASVVALLEGIGLHGLDAGPLANAVVAEALTAVLIGLNRRYKVKAAGIRITGLVPPPEGGA